MSSPGWTQVAELARRSVIRTMRQPALGWPSIFFPLILLALACDGATQEHPRARDECMSCGGWLLTVFVLIGCQAGQRLAVMPSRMEWLKPQWDAHEPRREILRRGENMEPA